MDACGAVFEFDGLSIPTFFVTREVAMRTIGPCVELFFGAIHDGATGSILPDVRLILPREDAIEAALRVVEFLRAVAAPNVVALRVPS